MDMFADDGRRALSAQDAKAIGQLTEADFLDDALPAIGRAHGVTSWIKLWRLWWSGRGRNSPRIARTKNG
jgi:hypothetical protein